MIEKSPITGKSQKLHQLFIAKDAVIIGDVEIGA
jgi:carbonic anhydrase/acetyltransferase-like protein (isoleucine patch superfamily)